MDRQEREAAVLEYIRPRDDWTTSVEMAKALSIPKGTLTGVLGRMVSEGTLQSRVPALGGGYRLAGEPMDTMHDDPAPDGPSGAAPVIPPPEQPADEAPAPAPETPSEPVPAAGDLDYFNGLRRDWYDGKVEMDVDQLFAFATRMRDELLGKLTSIQQCHVYRLPVVAGDLATGEAGVHWIDGLDQSEVSAAIHDSKAPGVYESVDWKAGPPESPAAGLRPFAGIDVLQMECRGLGRELSILDELEGLDDAARERVLGYAFARWPGKLDIVREVEVRYPTPDSLVTEILDSLDRFARTAP